MSMGEKLPYACGGIVVAGALYLVLALIIKLVGVKRAMRFLPRLSRSDYYLHRLKFSTIRS